MKLRWCRRLSDKRFLFTHTKSASIGKSHSLATVDGGPQQTLLTNFANFGNRSIKLKNSERNIQTYQKYINLSKKSEEIN